ncbi:hypothetical protein G3580_09440 [Nitrogeniibacter mangrovi]|uniref:Uncharacterized protein n=1 Tax=Nitrogeniibacter mangrovi TaxID=2016596 RepID=A0A6C1B6H4_9RHOO|nr:hypothetical protein [Nitrogeniibacter mangrovi]QID17844.1 hypothetical protein G3580_09440 [Nitrogeniibacter mangrovi]
MQIKQLQVNFDAREDRLMLRIATAERDEIAVALTRRLIKVLWPFLQRMLEGHLAAESGTETEETLQATLGAGSFSEPFDEDDLSHPLGTDPVLAMESRLQPIDGPACRIMLGEIRGRQVSFDCDRDLLEALCAMIQATVEQADWDLDLAALALPEPTVVEPDASPTLH